jgi:tetratricopeptide (TPR) repeat protein
MMQQAKIYWDLENYAQVEKIFRKSVEFCNDQDVWKLNVAHVLFMQENKYKEAAGFYEPIVKKHYDNVTPACCVSFIRLIKWCLFAGMIDSYFVLSPEAYGMCVMPGVTSANNMRCDIAHSDVTGQYHIHR